ncbi:MAG: CCA tRNA nucleotidyltransferase [Pigmentiphaga sp.]|uniref:CCA tRNA nucleotidyltransferase n=1 Tax=Pigmentiphaga daeguensis TaxID=414049 RepID=A0ABN1BPY3_9BURK|nr:CCA tRNA nucleotidyltransferase [Pigmentiphaga sp. NML030171]OVZ63648.1 CCA tRNA nucleotidyltransferase [Pigmentiphaga sp. NML030171]
MADADLARPAPGPDPATDGLAVFVVGGAVRDALLGLPAGDRDWVVVGATPEQMSARGFVPVGGDFPVFLHPATREEYALARTERKSGRGYKGFTFHTGPEVTLEDDLGRRDLTINAIAQAPDGRLIDPYGGRDDLRARRFRHVGPAFAEDPVRILRLARFAARFHDFAVAPETLELCRRMAAEGEVDALVPERVWRELSRGLMQERPSRMLQVLADTDALPRVAPGLAVDGRLLAVLDQAADAGLPLASRYALLCSDSADPAGLGKRLRASNDCNDMARLLQLALAELPRAGRDPERVLALLERADALRKPERFEQLLAAAQRRMPVDVAQWTAWRDTVRGVDAGAIAARHADRPGGIREAVRSARLAALSGT